MSGYCAVRRFGFNSLTIRRQQYGRHKSQRTEPLRNDIGLHIAVIILTGPDNAAVTFKGKRDHVIDQTVFVPKAA